MLSLSRVVTLFLYRLLISAAKGNSDSHLCGRLRVAAWSLRRTQKKKRTPPSSYFAGMMWQDFVSRRHGFFAAPRGLNVCCRVLLLFFPLTTERRKVREAKKQSERIVCAKRERRKCVKRPSPFTQQQIRFLHKSHWFGVTRRWCGDQQLQDALYPAAWTPAHQGPQHVAGKPHAPVERGGV
jgi:hypothetical protein